MKLCEPESSAQDLDATSPASYSDCSNVESSASPMWLIVCCCPWLISPSTIVTDLPCICRAFCIAYWNGVFVSTLVILDHPGLRSERADRASGDARVTSFLKI